MRELDSRVEGVRERLPYRSVNVSACSTESEEVSLGCPDDARVLLHQHLALGDAGGADELAGAGQHVEGALGQHLGLLFELQVFGGDHLGPGRGGVVHGVAGVAVVVGHDVSLAALEAERVLGLGFAALGSGDGGDGGGGVGGGLGGGGLLGLLAVVAVVAEGGELAVDGAAVADAVAGVLLLLLEGFEHLVDVAVVDDDGQLLLGESEAELQGGEVGASEPDVVAVGAASEAEEVAVALVHGCVSAAESQEVAVATLLVTASEPNEVLIRVSSLGVLLSGHHRREFFSCQSLALWEEILEEAFVWGGEGVVLALGEVLRRRLEGSYYWGHWGGPGIVAAGDDRDESPDCEEHGVGSWGSVV